MVIGFNRSISAYNPDNLVVPAQKVHVVLEEWLLAASPTKIGTPPLCTWARLELMHGSTPFRHRVLVSVKGRQEVFKHLVLKNQSEPLSLAEGGKVWVLLCDFLRAKRFQNSDGSLSNCLVRTAPVQSSVRCDVCVSRANRTLWKKSESNNAVLRLCISAFSALKLKVNCQ